MINWGLYNNKSKLVRFNKEHKTQNMPKENINKNLDIKDFEVHKF